jgi:hypothetical protein
VKGIHSKKSQGGSLNISRRDSDVLSSIIVHFQLNYVSPLVTRRILKIEPPIPDELSPAVKDFICKLLVKEPRQRLGGGPGDAEEVKSHQFFRVSGKLISHSNMCACRWEYKWKP